MRPLESDIERKLTRELKKLGITSIKLRLLGDRGWPDRLILLPGGRPLFLELKRPGGKTSKQQEIKINLLHDLGYHVAISDNVDRAINYIRSQLETSNVKI